MSACGVSHGPSDILTDARLRTSRVSRCAGQHYRLRRGVTCAVGEICDDTPAAYAAATESWMMLDHLGARSAAPGCSPWIFSCATGVSRCLRTATNDTSVVNPDDRPRVPGAGRGHLMTILQVQILSYSRWHAHHGARGRGDATVGSHTLRGCNKSLHYP